MDEMNLQTAITDLIPEPLNPIKNFQVGLAYDAIGQTASAVSFYLRAAEYGYDSEHLVVYTSLLKASSCFSRQGEREHTVENLLKQAIAYLPKRPEAYFLLSQRKERKKDYNDSYLWANIGLAFADEAVNNPLPADVEYFPYGLLFEKAVSAWWVGRKDESESISQFLLDTYEMRQDYVNSCIYNLKMVRDKNAS